MAKNSRSVSILIAKLIERTNSDEQPWKKTQPELFETTVLGRKIEVEWENGDPAALYMNNRPIKGDVEEIEALYKAVQEQQDRKRPEKRNMVRDLLRDMKKRKL